MTIEKGKIGREDIEFGAGDFERKGRSGNNISLTKINAGHIPILDDGSKFVSDKVEGALQECQVENANGSSSKSYINKSGATRSLGDVVVIDTTNDEAFTTTTTSGSTNVLGVVAETIADGASGKVITGGYVEKIAVDSSTSRGNFLKTSSTAGKAAPTTSFESGSFAVALTGGSSYVSALLVGSAIGGSYLPLTGGALTGILKLAKGSDIASASQLVLGTDGNYFDVTGTTNISSIASVGIGTVVTLHFDSSLTISHDSVNGDIILPGSVDITTSAGDEITFIEYATGKWRCIGYVDASTTGTENIVRSNTPTLVTPKVDTINEATAGNGVTIDGLNIKDGLIASTGIPNDSITSDKIDWANAKGLAFSYQFLGASTSSTGFVDLGNIMLYIPSNVNSLIVRARVYITGDFGYFRITDGTNTSNTQSFTNQSYTWLGELSFTPSATGWLVIRPQAYVSSGVQTLYLHGMTIVFV